MSTTTVPSTVTEVLQSSTKVPLAFKHPLDPLTPDEIAAASLAVRKHIAALPEIKAIKFITLYLLPAPKRDVLAFLGIPLSPGSKPEEPRPIVRKAEADFLDLVNGGAYNVILSLIDGEWTVDTIEKLPEIQQPQISVEELVEAEGVIKADERVRKLAADVGVTPDQIVCDGWSIGYDERFPQSRRVQQALVFARFSKHDNLYAHPMDFVPVIDANTLEVIHIDFPPRYKPGPNGPELTIPSTAFPSLTEDGFAFSGRERIPPPLGAFNFLPDLQAQDDKEFKPRVVKPLYVVQPDGVGFSMDGNVLEWQNWKMHISFTQREGIALSTITYNDNGEVRPLFYRLSLAEMVVPYGAPEYPHPRKFAFDSGEYGMGTMANQLSLGCDCLGQIHYLPGAFVAHNGSAIVVKNVICIHEEDDGVLWKHTDYRPGGRSRTVRRRRLVVSMVCTLANYEYIWNYYFYQDGGVELEIRLTGVLQVYVSADGEPSPYGVHVAPNVNAQYHQHLFSLRVDPMIDGLNNSIVESDIFPVDAPTGSAANFAGNAFVTKDTILKTEGGRQFEWEKERRWKIVNTSKKHYSSGLDVGYIIMMKGGATPMMAKPDSWCAKRAAFCTNAIWVCKDVEGPKGSRMWPSGKYVPQTREEPEDSIGKWVEGKQNVDNDDIVVFLTVGTTHIPKPEDWPVMPVEHLNVMLKPNSFFKFNPSLDVPSTSDAHSVSAFPSEPAPTGHCATGGACH
ncbi:Copper amine oxidase 1 [Hypsizygus marmoreus]|uniref:Amine oxidase n=1 Tax=Hypsizygus marmoreus TaxID=39966 RepID=A0A369JIS2_HYPMA|nr:Copper amine oxidase 1 [Hypsizygus marmoreus]